MRHVIAMAGLITTLSGAAIYYVMSRGERTHAKRTPHRERGQRKARTTKTNHTAARAS